MKIFFFVKKSLYISGVNCSTINQVETIVITNDKVMEKRAKYLMLTIVMSMLIFLNDNVLQAQSDSFFNKNIDDRESGISGYDSLDEDYIFSYKLFEENGFTFNGFSNGNDNDGFTFNEFDFVPEEAPVGSGLLLLSCAGVLYVGTKRNRNQRGNNK